MLEVVSAQIAGDHSRLDQCLSRLMAHADEDVEAGFLLAAHHAQRNQFDAAIGLLQSIENQVGAVVEGHGLVLQFPLLPAPLPVAELPSAQEAARLLREHLLVHYGRASEVVAAARPAASPALAPLAAWVLAEAHAALSRHGDATEALRRAVYAVSPPPVAWARPLRAALADAYEARGELERAAEEWRLLALDGDAAAETRLHAVCARLAECVREEQRRREAEERARAELEEQLRREADARARHEAARREAERQQAEILRREAAARREAERELERQQAEARRLEEAARREAERAAARERAAREEAQREHDAAVRWTTKIQAAKTPGGRRSALQSGLAELTSPHLRQGLLVEAARADVQAVLFKASTLKTARAKRRHLEDALAALRTDEVPDDLQTQEIALLERSLADIEAAS
ncbi:hypothetical protein [Nannocystis pusilla]|uniref:Uncharacterized protein n=1 Tax=Nannocystis pusilla TaxID=889268 RepID=A0ABS7TKI8_9BACT|nr:hypothetical protein [Nannocystis pusilla]MBZ5708748.1 hypothetical protein [Nannocystis pusilla]